MTTVWLTFIATFLLLGSLGLLIFYRDAVLTRLASVVAGRNRDRSPLGRLLQARADGSAVEQIVTPFHNVLPRSPEEASAVQKRLIRAGLRKNSHLNAFYGAKVMVPLVLITAALVTGAVGYSPFFVLATCAGLGFLLPDFWLGARIANRQAELQLGLPEALDLLVICVEAGLSLDQAMQRVSQEMRRTQPEISDELSVVNLEQKAGRPRTETWKNLAERTAVPSIRALVNMLVQSDNFGSSVAKTLRVYSDTLRTQRRQQVEEQAAKTTVKLIFPLVLFIFPSLFVVVLGPSAIVMLESIEKYLLNT